MKVIRPRGLGAVGACFHALGWSLFWAGLWAGAAFLFSYGRSMAFWPLAMGGWAVVGLVAIPITLRAPFAILAEWYEVTATEVVVHHGVLWRDETRALIKNFESVSLASGPLERLLGAGTLSPLCLGASLRCVAAPEELRRHLIARRDALRAAENADDDRLLRKIVEAIERRRGETLECGD